jgi:hypothetical protein
MKAKQIQAQQNVTDLYTQHAAKIQPAREGLQIGTAQAVKSDLQLTAVDLYERGLNVFPIPYKSKEPYLTKQAGLYYNRLHHCSALCAHAGTFDITELFQRDNLAVMTGKTSGNLIGIDCDTHAAFVGVGEGLAAHALPYWAITGKRGGVYLLRVIEGEAANIPAKSSRVPDVEIWGNRHFVVLPPSIHPSGISYEWATPEPRYHLQAGEGIPAVSIKRLDWLGVTLAKSGKRWEEPQTFDLPQWAAMLSYSSRETLAGVGVSEENRNRNTSLFNALCDLRGNGIEYHEAEQIAREYAHKVGIKEREAISTLKSAYSQDRTTPAEYYGEKSGGQRVREWQRAQALAESYDWRGTFGARAQSRKRCYLACIERAQLEGRLHWRATTRELAERAGTDKNRIVQYLRDLAEVKLIKRTNAKGAGVYRFLNLPNEAAAQLIELPKTQGEQDVFSRLGLNAWHVWRYLLQNLADNPAQIARETKLPRTSVYSAVKILQHDNVRLVSRGGDGKLYGEPRTEASLQSMALFWNDGASPSKRRKEAHRVEREIEATRRVRNARARWVAK